jgi:serine O-acetyltransferase
VSKPSNIISTGVVIGETAVIGDDVSILHCVTLGSNGHASGDRHPKVRSGVLIGAGATLLGNIRLGDNAKIGAGAVVLHDVPVNHIAIGIPARCKWAVKAEGSTHGEQHVFLR